MRPRRLLVAAVRATALAVAVLVGLPAAGASAAVATPASIAAHLRDDHVYVDPSVADSAPTAKQKALRAAIASARTPIYAVFIPLAAGDRYGGDAERLLTLVHSRLERDGVYVTTQSDGTLEESAFGSAESQNDTLFDAEEVADFETESASRLPGIDRALRFVQALGDPHLAARFTATEARLKKLDGSAGSDPPKKKKKSSSTFGLIIGLLVLVLAFLGRLWIVRRQRRSRPSPADEAAIPERVAEHARVAQAHELRERVEQSLVDLAGRSDRAPTPQTEEGEAVQQRALDSMSAARKVLDRGDDLGDLVGAQALTDQAAALMRRASAIEHGRAPDDPARLCFFDPRHGRATGEVTWRRGLRVPACAACAADIKAKRTPPALVVDGTPWYARDDLWAKSGYGLWDDGLATKVLSGEH